jgi:hypothetical protein
MLGDIIDTPSFPDMQVFTPSRNFDLISQNGWRPIAIPNFLICTAPAAAQLGQYSNPF